MDLCMSCSNPVRPRQEGLQCDGCNRWLKSTTAKVIASVKAKAVEDLFKPASAIVDEVCFHLFNENNDECE